MADQQERSRAEELKRYSYAGMMEKAHLENGLLDAEKAAQERPDDQDAALRLEVARKKMELFSAEHDNAGAFKMKKFGRKVQELFEPGPDGRPGIETAEDCTFSLAESQKDRRFLLVNMGELDRFNKEGGGHAAGDAALGETAAAVERAVTEALGVGGAALKSDYQIYRYDGNTFMVDIASMPVAEFGALARRMQEARPSVPGVKDPAPLTVRGLDLANVIEIVNHVQAELPKEGKLEAGGDAAREMVEVLRRAGDWDLEVNKLYTRAERMRGKIEAEDPEAAAFYENYVRKSFQDTELGTFEGFKAAVAEGRYHAAAEAAAIGSVEKRFAAGRKVDDAVQETIDARVRARGIPPERDTAESAAAEAAAPGATDGERVLASKREAMLAAEAAATAATGAEAASAGLRAESARLEYRIESARRDKGTGLLERGVHYEDLEKALEEGKDVATLFVDMGFLKYFDQMGGSEVGDAALRTAAAMMEEAVKRAGVKGKVYRYGGDEFTIQVEGGDDAARAVENALEDLRDRSEPIASGPKSRAEYAPTRLAFNYGRADRKMLEDLHGLAARDGKYAPDELEDPARMLNAKAELMTKAADGGIEYNKAFSRFELLIEESREIDRMADGPEKERRRMQFESKKTFSGKAIFAELGGKEKLEALAASGLEGDALEEQIVDFVLEKVVETRAKESGKREVLDALLAAQVKVAFLQDRLREMEGVIDLQAHRLAKVQEALAKAEEEKRGLIEARGSIDRAA